MKHDIGIYLFSLCILIFLGVIIYISSELDITDSLEETCNSYNESWGMGLKNINNINYAECEGIENGKVIITWREVKDDS